MKPDTTKTVALKLKDHPVAYEMCKKIADIGQKVSEQIDELKNRAITIATAADRLRQEHWNELREYVAEHSTTVPSDIIDDEKYTLTMSLPTTLLYSKAQKDPVHNAIESIRKHLGIPDSTDINVKRIGLVKDDDFT